MWSLVYCTLQQSATKDGFKMSSQRLPFVCAFIFNDDGLSRQLAQL